MKLLLTILLFSFINPSKTVVLHHKYYTTIYDEANKTPLFTIYTLHASDLSNQTVKRSLFHSDTLEGDANQTSDKDYLNSGYDKGHLAPDDDFRFSKDGESESMVYTNCAPQVSSFNRGLWLNIENYTRKLAVKYDSVLVITGVIYSDTSHYLKEIYTRSPQNFGLTPIPDFYFKVDKYKDGIVCFLCRNAIQNDHNINHFQVSLDSLVKMVKL